MFEMVERHYFRGELVKSYDFQFGFCIPGSTNTWQAVYDVPPMSESRSASGRTTSAHNSEQPDSPLLPASRA